MISNSSKFFLKKIKLFKDVYQFINYHNFEKVLHINCENKSLFDKNRVDIITVAFNNDEVIRHQIRLLNKYLLDPYCYTVADNSSDPTKQDKITEICKQFDVSYIRLPKNPYNEINPSLSHGLALNWIYRNYVCSRKANFFGFIDHDIFPVYPTTIINSLRSSNVYGLVQERGQMWYLWPGFCFFKYDFIKNRKVDFMPIRGNDTGGGNWRSIYSSINKEIIPMVKHEYRKLRDGEDPQEDWVEYIGDWLHTFNASKWKKVKEGKDTLVNEILNKH